MKPLTGVLLEKIYFEELSKRILSNLHPKEHLFINFAAEFSQFMRLNGARVRQIGSVEDASISLKLVMEERSGEQLVLRKSERSLTLTGISYLDQERIDELMTELREETPTLPPDPYAQLPTHAGSSSEERVGNFPGLADSVEAVLAPVKGVDVAGIWAAGRLVRAMSNSAGQLHWFSTGIFSFDYSLYTPDQRALKGCFAGTQWEPEKYRNQMADAARRLELLKRPSRKLERGSYRAYLEPAAFGDLVSTLSSGALSEAAIRQGDSPLRFMRGVEPKKFSPLFTLGEDFSGGEVPRFNDEGELAPERLPLIAQGALNQTLVSSRSAKEYGARANGATSHEGLRAPSVAPGTLATADILAKLGTGLYLSNLHYLNWSDQPGGRITGMTRYACFWVENGEIVAPIENMRFDVSVFSVFGSALEELSLERAYLPEVHTYEMRSPGGQWCPGALLSEMQFTI